MRIPRDSVAGRRKFEREMEERRWLNDAQGMRKIRRGWYLGNDPWQWIAGSLVMGAAGYAAAYVRELLKQA